jgi:hypothetical protein
MATQDEYQLRALDCLLQIERAKNDADRRTWKMLAGSFLLLRRFQRIAEQQQRAIKSEAFGSLTG